jgi:hypothetical protein
MSNTSSRVRRGLLIALVAVAVVAVARALGPGGPSDRLLPTIGGDTWPPVPVKDT